MPNRYSRPEVQISMGAGSNASANHLTLSVSLEEAQRIEAESAPIREAARKILEEYEQRRNGSNAPGAMKLAAK